MNSEVKVLVIDDEPGIRELLIRELSIEGYTAESAADGLEALEKIGNQKYQVALCDLNMPNLGGLEALDEIRKRWEPMTRFETGAACEGFGPSESCHNMGAAPVIYLSRHVLGVQVDGPVANRRLLIEPRLGDLKRAEGVVVTEFGPVPVCWDRSGADGRLKFDVEIPAGVKARVSLPRPADNVQLTIDGQTVKPASNSSKRFVTIELGEGKHSGR